MASTFHSTGRFTLVKIVEFHEKEKERLVIMIVDDEPAILAVLTEFLNDCGFVPLSAQSGDDARDVILSGMRVDLVFSDVRTPGSIDGYGLAQWVIAHRPEIPIILVSGDLGKADAATELCGVEMFPKPYELQAAARKITETNNLHRQRRA